MPKQINGFTITGYLEGGMGVVYRGEKQGFKRAFKTIKVDQKTSHSEIAKLSQRFLSGIGILQRLSHPNIVTALDVYPYIDDTTGIKSTVLEMEWLEGCDLERYVTKSYPNGMEPEWVKNIALKAVDALEYAHKNNVLHLDIKPSNIFYTTERYVKIIDFGISKVIGENAEVIDGAEKVSTRNTQTGGSTFRGTIAYASPEQWGGEPVDKRSDIYSFGKTLFFLLTGSTNITAKKIADPQWSRIVKKCTELHKDDRYQSFAELRDAIQNNESATVKCEKCGKLISKTSKFCPECGNPNTPQKPTTKRCSKCGKEVPVGTKFCDGCGTPIRVKKCSSCGYVFDEKYSGSETRYCCKCGKPI